MGHNLYHASPLLSQPCHAGPTQTPSVQLPPATAPSAAGGTAGQHLARAARRLLRLPWDAFKLPFKLPFKPPCKHHVSTIRCLVTAGMDERLSPHRPARGPHATPPRPARLRATPTDRVRASRARETPARAPRPRPPPRPSQWEDTAGRERDLLGDVAARDAREKLPPRGRGGVTWGSGAAPPPCGPFHRPPVGGGGGSRAEPPRLAGGGGASSGRSRDGRGAGRRQRERSGAGKRRAGAGAAAASFHRIATMARTLRALTFPLAVVSLACCLCGLAAIAAASDDHGEWVAPSPPFAPGAADGAAPPRARRCGERGGLRAPSPAGPDRPRSGGRTLRAGSAAEPPGPARTRPALPRRSLRRRFPGAAAAAQSFWAAVPRVPLCAPLSRGPWRDEPVPGSCAGVPWFSCIVLSLLPRVPGPGVSPRYSSRAFSRICPQLGPCALFAKVFAGPRTAECAAGSKTRRQRQKRQKVVWKRFGVPWPRSAVALGAAGGDAARSPPLQPLRIPSAEGPVWGTRREPELLRHCPAWAERAAPLRRERALSGRQHRPLRCFLLSSSHVRGISEFTLLRASTAGLS